MSMRTKNILFRLRDFYDLFPHIVKLICFHPQMGKKIVHPKYGGIKGWEYGKLLDSCDFNKDARVLDVGTGGSLIPYFLASKKGVRITTFDLETSTEKPKFSLKHRLVSHAIGTMLKLPFADAHFDIVLCISAIEHLDHGNYTKFLKDTKKAISKLIRVTKPNGYIFLTSDIYFPLLQKTDRWDGSSVGSVGTAYKREDFERIFLEGFKNLHCRLVGNVDFDFDAVINRVDRCIYRGRYFTTFALYAQKKS